MTSDSTPMDASPLLDIERLSVTYRTDDRRRVVALRDVSLSIGRGEILAVVGRSGSGKTSLARAITRLLPADAELTATRLLFDGCELQACDEEELRRLRGGAIGWVVQNALHAWSPRRTIGAHLADIVRTHHEGLSATAVADLVARTAADVGFERVWLNQRAEELSGGMLQRAAVAAAIVASPPLVLADEPTSALDSIAKAQLLRILASLPQRQRRAVLYITHDLAAMRRIADRVVVLDDGRVVEAGPVAAVMSDPRHTRTQQLVRATQPILRRAVAAAAPPVLELRSVTKTYAAVARGAVVKALDNVDVAIRSGEIVAVVGPSGSGKSTLARLLVRLEVPTEGAVRFQIGGSGTTVDLASARRRLLAKVRPKLQMVFQDPFGSLNPRRSVFDAVAEPLRAQRVGRADIHDRVTMILRRVELETAEIVWRYPFELSGGQRQRVALARALVGHPEVVVADEPTSMVDAVVEADLLRLMVDIRDEIGTTFVIITHDMSVARRCSDQIVVMDSGRVVERGSARTILDAPRHSTTRALVAAGAHDPVR